MLEGIEPGYLRWEWVPAHLEDGGGEEDKEEEREKKGK